MQTYIVGETLCRGCAAMDAGCEFRVEWRINPHMRVGEVLPGRAREQHARFVSALEILGATVIRLPFVHGAFDSVFTKDSIIATVAGGRLRMLPATPRHAERATEPGARAEQLAAQGFDVEAPLGSTLEGGDIVTVLHRRVALLGHGVRSEAASAKGLARFLGCDIVPLELRDPKLYHLDTALAVLDDDTLLVCEDAFEPAALRTLRAMRFGRVVSVPLAEATRFAVNVIEVGAAVVSGTVSPVVESRLGRPIVTAPLDEFHKAGGSAACLVAAVHDLDAVPARAAA